jgi:hypothetical protein
MDRLESDIRSARARANAWATGDIEALKNLVETDATFANSLAYSWPFLSNKEVKRLHREAETKLLSAMERAMNRNQVTFAALPIHLLLRKDGLLAQLRALGYSIEEPV